MTSSRLSLSQNPRDPEAIILEHYTWLLDWAHQLTRGTSEEAEDLVQDLCVRLMRMKTQPELLNEDVTRAYLYKALRNLFLSKRLRHGHDAVSGLLVVDFDSVSWAMSAVDRNKLLYVRSDLARICDYACIRRKSSGAAAALILRFFLGYLPTEAMAILKSKRARIDSLTQAARLEAKAYLERPSVLRFLDRSDKRPQTGTRNLPEESDALFAELLRRIFAEPQGECFAPGSLEDRYTTSVNVPFNIQEIAHLVSCRSCLHLATEILALPDLTLQFLPDSSGPGEADPPATRSEKTDLKKLRRKLRETYEHRPIKLQIIVDGVVRGVQSITGVSSKVQIALEPLSKPGFVEILSEQGLGLLYLDLQPDQTELPNTQQADVELSDGRQLSVALTLSEGVPVIHVSYYDPLFEAEGSEPPSGFAEAQAPFVSSATKPLTHHGWRDRLRDRLRGWWKLAAISIVLACLVAAFLSRPLHRGPVTTPSSNASTVLSQSDERLRLALPAHGAVHSRFSLDVTATDSDETHHLEVEALRSADQPLEVVRLRAEGGALVAAREVDAKGTEHNLPSSATRSDRAAGVKKVRTDGLWQYPPDARTFLTLAAGAKNVSVSKVASNYEVGFRRSADSGQATIVEAKLEIDARSMRPVAETLEFQEGDARREYHFKELVYEVLPASRVHEVDFRPEPIGGDRPVSSMQGAVVTSDPAQLMLAVLEVLSKQQIQVQDSINIERRRESKIVISGVLQSAAEKKSLTKALKSIYQSSDLVLDLHSPEEPQPKGKTVNRPLVVDSAVPIESKRLPMDAMLRRPLMLRGIEGSDLEARISTSADVLVNSGARLHREAWIANQVATQDFTSQELQAMRPDKRARWLALLKLHLEQCTKHLTVITSTLALKQDATGNVRSNLRLQPYVSAPGFSGGLQRFVEVATKLDDALATGFALSPEAQQPSGSPAELEELIANLQTEESRLDATIDRLYANSQQRGNT